MKSTRGWVLLIGIEFLAVCICLGFLGVLISSGTLSEISLQSAQAPPTSTSTARRPSPATLAATLTPSATETPAPTYTRVIPPLPADFTPPPLMVASRTPTRGPVPYNVFIPTPTAPAMVYPIKLDSSFKVVTYPVLGKTENELRQSLVASAFPDTIEPNRHYNARTDWALSVQSSVQPTMRGCEVETSTITLAMTMTLPALSSNAGVPSDVLSHWTTFISNTITHESGHVTRNYQGASNFQRELGNALPAADCTTLKARLSDLFTRATGTIGQSSVDYDAETQHGAKQGAVFP